MGKCVNEYLDQVASYSILFLEPVGLYQVDGI